MLSMIDATGRRTAACALRNCLYLFPLGALATWLGVTSPYFAYESGALAAPLMLRLVPMALAVPLARLDAIRLMHACRFAAGRCLPAGRLVRSPPPPYPAPLPSA